MPRNDQVTRQWHLLRLLESPRGITLDELKARQVPALSFSPTELKTDGGLGHKDRIWHPSQQLTRLPRGRMRMTLMIADSREVVGWILSFGGGARVIRPESLRGTVREEAKKIWTGP